MQLPTAPGHMRPVPWPQESKSAVTYVGRLRGSLDAANGRLSASGQWYECVRAIYSGEARTGLWDKAVKQCK